jgi:hypothetical protein
MRLSISFCGACMGRRHHLEHTLPNNLIVTRPFGSRAEIVIVDYNSPDALREWVLERFPEELESGRLRYFRTDEPTEFLHAHAKNVAHRLARNELVFNLDADNFIGDGMCQRLDHLFAESQRRIAHDSRERMGRLCLRREDFLDGLCGYDERFVGWGLEDDDLFSRARLGLALEPVSIAGLGHVITHEDDERFANMTSPEIPDFEERLSELPERLRSDARYLGRQDRRRAISFVRNAPFYLENMRAKRARVVAPGSFGRAHLVDHRGREVTL